MAWRRVLALLALAAPLALADALALATSLELADPGVAGAAEPAAAWRGRICTPLGCGPLAPASWSHTAGFGAAVLGVAWAARRRSPGR